ncbi:MAG: bifunctional nuclease family protein [Elusimicrobia bacterium]|nr:bifunctional nuclease family protein [Elusimicrobiota bacterium]
MLIPVNLYSLVALGSQFVVVLEEIEGPRLIPIWIGAAEGNSIAMHLNRIQLPRPMTHDLIINLVNLWKSKIVKVVITELKESTFYASIYLQQNNHVEEIDARPSDSIALALRASAPLFVDESVFQQCEPLLKPISKDELNEFKRKLADLKPEDIYKDINKRPPQAPPPPPTPPTPPKP